MRWMVGLAEEGWQNGKRWVDHGLKWGQLDRRSCNRLWILEIGLDPLTFAREDSVMSCATFPKKIRQKSKNNWKKSKKIRKKSKKSEIGLGLSAWLTFAREASVMSCATFPMDNSSKTPIQLRSWSGWWWSYSWQLISNQCWHCCFINWSVASKSDPKNIIFKYTVL